MFKLIYLLLVLFRPGESRTYSHAEAASLVRAVGITLSSSGNYNNRANSQCTSLDGIHSEAIDGIIKLKVSNI